jgi:hypothetical protein
MGEGNDGFAILSRSGSLEKTAITIKAFGPHVSFCVPWSHVSFLESQPSCPAFACLNLLGTKL